MGVGVYQTWHQDHVAEILRIVAVRLVREHDCFDVSAFDGDDAVANGRFGDR